MHGTIYNLSAYGIIFDKAKGIFLFDEDGNKYYSSFIPDLFIHSEYKPDVIQSVINRQKKIFSLSTHIEFHL